MLILEMQYSKSRLTLQKYSLEYCNPNLHIRYQMSLQQLQQKFKNFNPDTNCFKRHLMCTVKSITSFAKMTFSGQLTEKIRKNAADLCVMLEH